MGRTVKINLIILGVIFILAGGWAVYTSQKPPQFAQSNNGDILVEYLPAPNFYFMDEFGKPGMLHDFKGKVVLLHFWATWCAPCLVEFPELIALAEKMQDDAVILAVSTDHEAQAIPRFLNRLDVDIPNNFRIIHDVDKSITQDLYQTFKLPETYVIGPQSRIREKLIGPQDDWNSEAWAHKIESIRAN